METSINLGKVTLLPRGEYNPATIYEQLDLVRYQGSGYVALHTVQGVTPTDGLDFMLLVLRGEPGKDGSPGKDGGVGPTGKDGKDGATGPAGPGLPPGGAIGQVPVKASNKDYDVTWETLSGGENDGFVEMKISIPPTSRNYGTLYSLVLHKYNKKEV